MINALRTHLRGGYRVFFVFYRMNRKVSFEDKHGKMRYDKGTMFIPICSKIIYHHVMNSDKTFHYGKGYW